ncbi:putative bifunctional diguanylate cyclase/phosphodiesterase [Actinoplanes sp. NPDC051494]|uniref:putative bifunctional diguanylate cyclase/phosphodiesterase n=1 Tax=Actinoplanes sp. NPDC051494 TaxID=3363907 RepID=UPI0037884FAE
MTRAGYAATAVAVAGTVTAAGYPDARQWIFMATLLVLDTAGVVYFLLAARRSPYPLSWRLAALGRGASVLGGAVAGAAVARDAMGWWWVATSCRMAMFVLLAVAAFTSRVGELRGARRWSAFGAEILTVLAGGFMLIWYFALDPLLEHWQPGPLWTATIGFTIGDLLLLMAASTLLLGGAMPRVTHPVAPLVAGMLVYAVTDTVWSSMALRGLHPESSVPVNAGIVLGALLMTLSPIMLSTGTRSPAVRERLADQPSWSARLPVLALALGGGLMLTVTFREDDLLPWGGLVVGLIVMTAAIMARQVISLRDSRELVVTDVLTGLANRTGLDNAITRSLRRHETGALLLIDLDGFKLVNDAYGHPAGDHFLVTFAHHLRANVRHGDTCARIGGDEFAVWLPGAVDPESVAERLLDTPAVTLDDDTVPIRASIGVTDGTEQDTVKDLMRRADLAMYHAKRAGTHTFTSYDPAMTDRRAEDAALAEDLRHALERGELHVLYQPIVELAGGRTAGAEALLRWAHPTRGPISPVRFIPLAERSGDISGIGLWVLEQALTVRPDGGYMSVNLSPRQLQDPTLVHDVLAVLRRTGTDPRDLVLEITESALVDDTHAPVLQALREHGIRVAIDDFGTGYSSLQYLTRLPVDILKIDRAFVAELNGTPEGRAIAEAVIRLAQVLHLDTIAEGIETTEQAAELRTLGCDRGQGYLYAKPLTADALLSGNTPRVT